MLKGIRELYYFILCMTSKEVKSFLVVKVTKKVWSFEKVFESMVAKAGLYHNRTDIKPDEK